MTGNNAVAESTSWSFEVSKQENCEQVGGLFYYIVLGVFYNVVIYLIIVLIYSRFNWSFQIVIDAGLTGQVTVEHGSRVSVTLSQKYYNKASKKVGFCE